MSRVLVATVFVFSAGCSSNPYAELDGAFRELGDEACRCFAAFGYASREACLDEASFAQDAESRRCWKRAMGDHAELMDAVVDCYTPATDAHAACLRTVEACDADAVGACEADVEALFGACADTWPDAVIADYDACKLE